MTTSVAVFLAATKVLSLGEALQMAQKDQPTVHQAHANTDAAKARVGEARAPLLPQIFAQRAVLAADDEPDPGLVATIGAGSALAP